MLRLLLILLASPLVLTHAWGTFAPEVTRVYVHTNASGGLGFSDSPRTADAREHSLGAVPGFSLPADEERESSEQQPAAGEHFVSISSPSSDEAVRSNDGSLSVLVEHSMMASGEYRIALMLDGELVAVRSDGTFHIEQIDRGSHRLQARLHSRQGELLAQSEEFEFHLLRYVIPR